MKSFNSLKWFALPVFFVALSACTPDDPNLTFYSNTPPTFAGECVINGFGNVESSTISKFVGFSQAEATSDHQRVLDILADPNQGGRAVAVLRSSVYRYATDQIKDYYAYQIVIRCNHGNVKTRTTGGRNQASDAWNALPAIEALVDATPLVKRLRSYVQARKVELNDGTDEWRFEGQVKYLEVNPNPIN